MRRSPVLMVSLLLSVGACADCYALEVLGASAPLAVGASLDVHLQYGRTFDCKDDPLWPCGPPVGANRITALTAVKVDDPSLLAAEITGSDVVRVTALQAGTPSLTITGVDSKGVSASATKKLHALEPEVAVLTVGCLGGSAPEVHLFPEGSEVEFGVGVYSGSTLLVAEGLAVPIDHGALRPVPDGGPARFLMPDAGVRTTVRTQLGRPFELQLQSYAQVDGFALRPLIDGPQPVRDVALVQVRLTAQGLEVCREPSPPPSKHVAVLTPEQCTLVEGSASSSQKLGASQDLGAQRVFFVRGAFPGTCGLEVTVAGLGPQRLDLVFAP